VEQQTDSEAGLASRWFQANLSTAYDWGLQASDAIVTVSTYDVPFLEEQGYVPSDQIHSVGNPLPETFIGQDINVGRQKRLGFCGSWIPRKGIDLIREDVSSFLGEHPGWKFSIVGVGDQDVWVKFPEEVRDQIEVIPFLERPDLIEWYHSLSVFVLPSIYESFGLVIAEAMACGAAVVATNVGLAHTLTDREEALILPDPSSPHLKQALDQLASDEVLRQTIAQNGYEQVQELRWERAVEELESIYTRLASETDGC
jgi:glycosyltransferase involved in cell wall biosynthesis